MTQREGEDANDADIVYRTEYFRTLSLLKIEHNFGNRITTYDPRKKN